MQVRAVLEPQLNETVQHLSACRCVAAADDSLLDYVGKWTQQIIKFRRSHVLGCSLSTGAKFSGHPLEPLQLKKRRLSSTKSAHLASLENSCAMMVEHVVSVMKNIRCLRYLLGRVHAGSVWEVVGTEASLLLRYCTHMKWTAEVFATVDMFCGHTLQLLQWNNSSLAFWQPFSDVHLQPLLQFCVEAMTRAMELLGVGAASAVRSGSILLTVATTCLSRSWHRTKLSVVHQSDVPPQHARLLVQACTRMCLCVNAVRSCSNMTLLISLVTSLSRTQLLLECVWTLTASAMQLRSHVTAAPDPTDSSFGTATEAWAVACTQTTSFLILLHTPVRPDLKAALLYQRRYLFTSLPCGASREEMLHSASVFQRNALTLAGCLDYRGPMTAFQQIFFQGADMSLKGRFLVMCTLFGLHSWALQPVPADFCESSADGMSSAWSLRVSPVLFCCSEHLSTLHQCALAAVTSACRVNVSLVASTIGPAVLHNLVQPSTSAVYMHDKALTLPIVDIAGLCAIIISDGGCDWIFASEDRLAVFFQVMCHTLQYVLSPTIVSGSLTKIVIHAFAVFVAVTLEIVAPASTSQSRAFLRRSLQLPSVDLLSVKYLKNAVLIDKVDRQLGSVICTCIRCLRHSPSALGETEYCVISNVLMATRDIGGSCLSIIDSAWPLISRMMWRASFDTIQFVESLSDISSGLEKKCPSNVMCVGVPCMGIVIACIVLEARDANFIAPNTNSADTSQSGPVKSVREMFPVDLDPISVSSTHVAPYVQALMGKENSSSRIPTLVLLSQEADEAVTETFQLLPVQQELRDVAGADLRVSDLLGDVAIVFSKLPTLLQFILSLVVRKLGMWHADAAAEVCKRALGTAVVMSCHEWAKCNSMAMQVLHGLCLHAMVQAIVSDADSQSGAFGMYQLPPLQMTPDLREEAERQLDARDRPNVKVRLQSRVAAAAGRMLTGDALTLQAHSAMKAIKSSGRERLHGMLLKLYPQISTQQQQLKVVALSCVREAWIERQLVPLWVSVRVMKTRALGRVSRRRPTQSDTGLLPALLQVFLALSKHRIVPAFFIY